MKENAVAAALAGARPRVLAALTRVFRDLDAAEDAFQEACLRALRSWPEKGLPQDPTAWLIFVGRNVGLDETRRQQRLDPLTEGPQDFEKRSEANPEKQWIEGLEREDYRDDVLRLLFTCCHPELPAAQQIALALRIVVGMPVDEIARAFLVKQRTMEQRLTRAKRFIAKAGIPFEVPSPAERAQRLQAVTTTIYLLFNEGYSASGGEAHVRAPLCDEAIRLARLLLRLFVGDPEVMGLLALCLANHARTPARLDKDGEIVLLEDQDRSLWDAAKVAEAHVLVEKALRLQEPGLRTPGPLQIQAAIAVVHSSAPSAGATDWQEIDRLYALLERLQPSPIVTLNRAVAVSKARGPRAALEMLAPLAESLDGYLHFHGARGALLAEVGENDAAAVELRHALRLARTQPEKAHLRQRLREVEKNLSSLSY